MSEILYNHRMFAHCETGTVTGLLNYAGIEITEPLIFGISNGIFFAYFKPPSLPFPTFVVRNMPGKMFKGVSKRLGVKFYSSRFKDPARGEAMLDSLLEKNIPVACQVDFFYMDYLPEYIRVHINFHYIVIIGKRGDNYIVSDSYSPEIAEIDKELLRRGRYPGGVSDPKGFLSYPVAIPSMDDINMEKAIKKGIKKAAFNMIKLPVPLVGVKGIRRFANRVVEWPKLARDTEHLSHEIMKINILLEDQGTGGAGFRFMYAAFLKEASEILNRSELLEMSERINEIGDRWRKISLFSARMGKKRDLGEDKLKELSSMIMDRADEEEIFFKDLLKISKGL